MTLGLWCVSQIYTWFNISLTLYIYTQALEDGEDIQELADRTREKKDRRVQNKLLRDTEVSGRNTPASDSVDGRGRKLKKGKAKANDYEPVAGSKRKRGLKSMSATPDMDDDEEDHELVSADKPLFPALLRPMSETAKDEDCFQSQQYRSRYPASCA